MASALGAPMAQAEVSSEQLQALEARIAQLEAGEKEVAAPAADAADGKFKFNGFMSAGFGRADIDDFSYVGLDEDVSHTADSIVGLQVEGKVNDEMNAVLQLVARGDENFEASAEWAYIGWRPTEADEFRAGRLRTSFYMMSEYLEVGYAYPWITPPTEVYSPSFPSSYDGLAWTHKFNFGDWEHDFRVNWGSTAAADDSSIPVDVRNAWGVGLGSSVGDWQFGLNVSGAKLNASNDLFDALVRLGAIDPIEDADILYQAVGLQYDNGKLLALVEGTVVETDGVVADTESVYATLGYRFGKVMPHVTYATTRSTDDEERPDVAYLEAQDDLFGNFDGLPDLCRLNDPNPDASLCLARIPYNPATVPPLVAMVMPANTETMGIAFPADTLSRLMESDQTSVTLGVRYDFLANAAVKFDWTRVLDTHGTFGQFTYAQSNLSPTAVLADDEVDIFRVAVDVVF